MNALFIICGLGVMSLLAEIINFKKWLTAFIVIGLLAGAGVIMLDWNTAHRYFNDMVVFDNTSIAFTILISIIAVFWFVSARSYFVSQSHQSDRSALVVFSIAGAVLMVSFNNMAMLFLGIEILSVSLYVLAGSRKDSLLSTEASFKYFLLGSFATGFLLMGIALIYGATGSFDIQKIGAYVLSHAGSLPKFFYAGVLLMLIGMAFKMSAAPFHFWAPDVYDGSPTVVTAFMATVVKIAAVGAFCRVFSTAFVSLQPSWNIFVQVLAVLTLIIANITAVFQSSVKRTLAYSSVGHIGYILLAFISDAGEATGTIYYYLAAYATASLSSFIVLLFMERNGEGVSFESFKGLFKRNSFAAVALTISLLSLAGIPPLAGFFGKYLVFSLAIQKGYTGLVLVAVAASLVGVYYYFKVIISMFAAHDGKALTMLVSEKITLTILMIVTLLLGLFPDALVVLLH
jgi:NADH-quinone oxidoreductase subunit N